MFFFLPMSVLNRVEKEKRIQSETALHFDYAKQFPCATVSIVFKKIIFSDPELIL
jgi:hypothetical protein